jgi:hypothetical protein
MRARNNRFGFWSIVKQMLALLSTGELTDGGGGGREEEGGEQGFVQALGETVFRGSALFARWRPFLEAPALNKAVALLTATQLLLGLQRPQGGDAALLGLGPTAAEEPRSYYSVGGSDGSVTVVFPEQRLLKRVALQYALPLPAGASAREEQGAYVCAAPTRVRLLGWTHDPSSRQPRHRQQPLDLGDYVVPPAGLLVPAALRGNDSSSSSASASVEGQAGWDWEDEGPSPPPGRRVQQHLLALSPSSNVLLERVPVPTPAAQAQAPAYAFYGTYSADLPQFLRDNTGTGAGAGGRILRPLLRAVTVVVLANSNGNAEEGVPVRDDCTTLHRLRLLGAPESPIA